MATSDECLATRKRNRGMWSCLDIAKAGGRLTAADISRVDHSALCKVCRKHYLAEMKEEGWDIPWAMPVLAVAARPTDIFGEDGPGPQARETEGDA